LRHWFRSPRLVAKRRESAGNRKETANKGSKESLHAGI
jgi:hypothetical protein